MKKWRILITQLVIVGLCAIGWELVSRAGIIDSSIFSFPSEVARTGWRLVSRGVVFGDLGVTVLEILLGFGLAAIVGVVVGLAIGEVEALYRILHVPILMVYALPTIALFPIFVLFFGIGLLQKVVFGASWGVLPIIVNTIAGRRAVPKTWLTLGKSIGGSQRSIWWKIALPSSLPLIAAGLRIGMVYTILGVVVAELFMSSAGIGQKLIVAARHFQMANYFFYVAVLSAVSLTLTYLLMRFERHLSRWRQ